MVDLPLLLTLLVAAVTLALLGFALWRLGTTNRILEVNRQRTSSSRLVGRGELVDGQHSTPVALALTENAFYFESAREKESLDLEWVQEVEYDDELSNGRHPENQQVLRLRCFGREFEFLIPEDVAPEWQAQLPSRRRAS